MRSGYAFAPTGGKQWPDAEGLAAAIRKITAFFRGNESFWLAAREAVGR